MEAVDELILRDMRDIGCVVPEDIKSLKEMKGDVLSAAVLRCLRVLDKDRDHPRAIPKNMIQKVNAVTQMALRIKEMGYQHELSYHQILYPSEESARRILMWFQELFPKPDERPSTDDKQSRINKAIEEECEYLVSSKNTWAPHFVNTQGKRGKNYWNNHPIGTRDIYSPSTPVYYKNFQRKTAGKLPNPSHIHSPQEMEKYFANYLPLFTEQPVSKSQVAPSILEYNVQTLTEQREKENEWNTLGLESGLNPIEYEKQKKSAIGNAMSDHIRKALNAHAEKTMEELVKRLNTTKNYNSKFLREAKMRSVVQALAPTESEEELEQRRVAQREEALTSLHELEATLRETENRIEQYVNELRQLAAAIQEERLRNKDLTKKQQQIAAVFGLLPNAKENIEKLKAFSEENSEKLKALARQWEEMRVPLVDEYRGLREKVAAKEEEAKDKLEQIKAMRRKMKELLEEITKKDEQYKELLEVYKKLPKDNRGNYTKRILEMVKNVKKQVVEINKILVDTKNLQKEINMVTETLNRSFTVAEEMIFADAKKLPECSSMYKKLVNMNDNFNELVDTLEKSGGHRNDGMNLTEKITKIQGRMGSLNVETLQQDLEQVKMENLKLEKAIENVKK